MTDSNEKQDSKKRSTYTPTEEENRRAYQQFLAILGEAIQSWKAVEDGLLQTYLALIADKYSTYRNEDAPYIQAASAAFHSIMNFKTTLDMTTAAAEVRLQGQRGLLSTWNRLSQKAKGQATIRNRLVHQNMMFDLPEDGRLKFTIRPVYSDPRRDANQSYSEKQIRAFVENFSGLGHELDSFSFDVAQTIL